MKAEYKRLDNELNQLVCGIPVDEIKKIYYKRSYDSIRTLWIDEDAEGFKDKENNIIKFIEKMTYPQRRVCILEEAKAYNQVLYDLHCVLRSESIQFMTSIFNDAWFVNRVNDYLISYDETGNKEDLKKAMDFVGRVNKSVNTLNTPERIGTLELYVEHLRSNEDLTKEDIANLDFLNDYAKNYHLHASINGEEMPEDE